MAWTRTNKLVTRRNNLDDIVAYWSAWCHMSSESTVSGVRGTHTLAGTIARCASTELQRAGVLDSKAMWRNVIATSEWQTRRGRQVFCTLCTFVRTRADL